VSDALVEHVMVERGAELGPVICLDHLNREGQPLQDVVDELDRGLLVQRGVDPHHPQPDAVVDGGELVVPLARRGSLDGLDELDVDCTWCPGSCFS